MKKIPKTNKKLTLRDHALMWGDGGPYSQVRLCEETRILDDSVSRVFMVIEATINPFTFEYVNEHRKRFKNDEPVLQLLDHAEYREKFGYIVSAGETELAGEESLYFARRQADMTIKTIIRMHEFVIDECGLRRDKYGVIKDKTQLIWNEKVGRVEPANDKLWDEATQIKNIAGTSGNKARYFVVLALTKSFDFNRKATVAFARTLKNVSANFDVGVESVDVFQDYVLLTVLLPFDIAAADFIKAALDGCNTISKKPIFCEDYLITNIKKPAPDEIMNFLGQLPR